jgi:glycosyltransferase involved in cell wall biosynthesis
MVNELKSNGFTSDVIPWSRGVDSEIFSDIVREEFDHYTILYVGRVSKEKGLDDLCKINSDILDYRIQIVGDGPYRKELEIKYPHIDFVGYKKGKELAQYYRNADVLCFPSRTDTFGIVMIESMSMGTPVAAYPVAGPIDVIEQDVTGFMGEDLELAILDCLLLERDEVEEHSKKWTWENCWKIFKDNLVYK